MLCPAIKDPFDGTNFRIAAFCHQALLCPILCKLMCLFAPSNQQQIMSYLRQKKPSSSSSDTCKQNAITTETNSSTISYAGAANNGTNRQTNLNKKQQNIDIISDNNQLLISNCENNKIDKID
jgi:hypothetical protein